MKAIQVFKFGEPSVMQVKDVADLSAGPGEVVVTIKAAGVNPIDSYIRSGNYPLNISLPYTPGMDGAGLIKQFGEGVSEFSEGERVYIAAAQSGLYAEEVVCSKDVVMPLPDNISFSQGAAIGIPYATAWRALFSKAQAVARETVLIHGASGGVGTAAVLLAKNAGLTVIGTAGTPKGLDLIRSLGADFAFDHSNPGYQNEIQKCTAGRGVDIILEMLANVNLALDLEMIAFHGRLVVIGCRGNVEINPRRVMQKDAAILGMIIMNTERQQLQKIYSSLNQCLQNGKLAPVVGREFSLKDAAQAHAAIMSPGAFGKIVLIP